MARHSGITALIGGQYGSEGKGKIAAYLAREISMSIRTGGPNAGHTIEDRGVLYKLQSIPCAFINPDCILAIGGGGVIEPNILRKEIEQCNITHDRLIIDPQAGIIDGVYIKSGRERTGRLGSTGKGVGPAVAAKALRETDFHTARDIPELQPYLGDVASSANRLLDAGKRICLEGTQGFGLSNHHGPYPFVTSRDTTVGTLCGDAGVSPLFIDEIIMVIRTYPIRVAGNSGPMYREIDWNILTQEVGSNEPIIERTTVTNKVRRVGRFDIELVKRAVMINRPTQIAITFADYLQREAKSLSHVLE
jgi:adenylosuccinate synthase